MPGSITPLPVLLEEEDRKIYEHLEAPKSMVVRYGYQKLVAELPYDGTAKPGCGSKVVARTNRGVELAEMLTSTCPNAGCSKSVSRKEMLQYIDNSGGKEYPFTTDGKILRVATIEDLNEQSRLDARKAEIIKRCKQLIRDVGLDMRLVDVECLLGGERIIFYYTSENWVDFRELVKHLAQDYQTRIEMHQVNAREEARVAADYEKCGQHCCCKQFLKVLKPVSMRSAKVQKATLDPMKISGRCGRLMCCLRYEDETYTDLRKRLPHRKTLVETEDGIGIVLDTQILTQLVLVQINFGEPAAYPVENIRVLEKEEAAAFRAEQAQREKEQAERASARNFRKGRPDGKTAGEKRPTGPAKPEPRRPQPGKPLRDDEVESREGDAGPSAAALADELTSTTDAPPELGETEAATSEQPSEDGAPKRRRRRRRRGRGGRGRSSGGEGSTGGGEGSGGDGGSSPSE